MESPDVQNEVQRTTTGLAVKGINVARIRDLAVPNWSIAMQHEAVMSNARLEASITATVDESASLSAVHSSILADIFGGAQ
jgi:hypothetical protein